MRDSRLLFPLSGLSAVRVLGCMTAGLTLVTACTRSSPPEIPEFRPPPRRVIKEMPTPEPVADTPAPVPEPPRPPPSEPKPEPVKTAPAPPPPPEPRAEAPKAPSLVGTWRITEMFHKEQTMAMPGGMQMTLTFAEGGAVTMSTFGGPMPEAQTRQGTYSLAGDGQITISMASDTKTGHCTFDGNDRMTIQFDDMRMVLART